MAIVTVVESPVGTVYLQYVHQLMCKTVTTFTQLRDSIDNSRRLRRLI